MKIHNWWNKELTVKESERHLADEISDDLMISVKHTLSCSDCKIDNIEIETINRCNNDCSFCPVNIYNDKRKKCKMSVELFEKIINDLKKIKYNGIISLYSNNEPLLDERIYGFIKYIKENLPEARQELYTNGLLLNSDKLDALSSMLDRLVIDIYSEESKLPLNMKWLETYPQKDNVIAVMRNKHQILTSRAGTSPNKNNTASYKSFCIYPFRQMIVRPDGKISKCCHDAYGQYTLGDLNVQSVDEIWHGKKFEELRKKMVNKGRCSIESCRKCDVLVYDCPLQVTDKDKMKSTLLEIVNQRVTEGKKVYILGGDSKTKKLIEELENNKISYFELSYESLPLYLSDESSFLMLNYYSNDVIEKLADMGKKYPEDYIVYYRCF